MFYRCFFLFFFCFSRPPKIWDNRSRERLNGFSWNFYQTIPGKMEFSTSCRRLANVVPPPGEWLKISLCWFMLVWHCTAFALKRHEGVNAFNLVLLLFCRSKRHKINVQTMRWEIKFEDVVLFPHRAQSHAKKVRTLYLYCHWIPCKWGSVFSYTSLRSRHTMYGQRPQLLILPRHWDWGRHNARTSYALAKHR